MKAIAGHIFTTKQVTKTWNFDTSLNVQKRREDVIFSTQSSPRFVNLAYVQSQDISSDKNLAINDRSTYLAENRAAEFVSDQILKSVSSFNIETDKFLVTDVFINGGTTLGSVPLFFQHKVSRVLLPGERFVDIQILDSNYNPLTLGTVKRDLDNGIVYSNLENTFDPDTGLYNLYFISYLVHQSNGALERYTELLNNQPVYRVAEVEDLDEFGNIQTGIKVYIIQEDIGDSFSIKLPVLGDYGVRRLAVSSLRLLEPEVSSPHDPWFISVTNGKFIATVPVTSTTTSVFKYYVAEFAAQGYTPYYPYKLAYETSYRVNKRVIKTLRKNIAINKAEGLYPDVFVYKKDGTLKFALTANPDKIGKPAPGTGTLYSNVLLGDSRVSGIGINDSAYPVAGSSIDTFNGFIVLPAGYEISETDTVVTTYHYEEDRYEMSFLDLNPLSEASWLRNKLVVFVVPEQLGVTLTKSLYYLVVSEDGQVIDTDYEGFDENIDDGTLWYNRDPSTVSWAPPGSVEFLDKYSVEGTPSEHAFLVLGEVYVRGVGSPEALTFSDIRQRGGGIPEDKATELAQINPEVDWYWDIKMWDGLPYPAAATYFVEVPVEILEECGGRFTSKAVREICMRHTAAGVYPIVYSYNNYEPAVTSINYTPSGTYISWTQHADDAIFDIYTSPYENGPWTLVASGIANNLAGNQALLSIPETRYIIVTGRQSIDGHVCFSGPLKVIKDSSITNLNDSRRKIILPGRPFRGVSGSIGHEFFVNP